jgi:antitoxin CptB
MIEDIEKRRKRLTYRCWHRGTKELDLLIGSFADRHLADMDDAQLDRFETLLEIPEPVLFDWLTGVYKPPPEYDFDVTRLLLAFELGSPVA